jgi:hypothetical protein
MHRLYKAFSRSNWMHVGFVFVFGHVELQGAPFVSDTMALFVVGSFSCSSWVLVMCAAMGYELLQGDFWAFP